MGLRGRSVALLVTAAFLAGGSAGIVAARLLDPDSRPASRIASMPVDGKAQPPEVPPPPPAPPSSPTVPVPPPARAAVPPDDPASSQPPAPAALGVATLVVTFAAGPTPGPTDGAVYVLPAGAPGIDDAFTVPHGGVGEPIRVPAPATYDAGIRAIGGEHDDDVALATDVRVEPGETRRLEIARVRAVRKPIRMHVTSDGSVPLPEGWVVRVVWVPAAQERHEYPGRGEPAEARLPVLVRWAPRGEPHIETGPLPEGSAWRAEAFVEVADVRDPPQERLEARLRAVVVPSEARAGDRVEVRLEPSTLLRLRAHAPQGGWPAGVGPLRIVWTGVGAPVSVEYAAPWELEQGETLEVSVGPGRLTWAGPGFVAGQSEAIVATPAGEGLVQLEPRIELDPAHAPVPSRLFVHVRAGERPIDVDEPASVYRFQRALRGAPPDWEELDRSWASDLRIDLPLSSADETHRILVVHRSRSSDVLDVRSSADVQVELRPGGYLVLVPESAEASPFATALERADGGPMLSARIDATTVVRTVAGRVAVEPGLVLGPFPEGPVRLRLLRAGLPVAELTPTVRADAYVPLGIPR